MEYIIGILILASFFGLAVYAARGGNLMMGMLVMAILWTILPMTGNLLASNPDFIAAMGTASGSHGYRHFPRCSRAVLRDGAQCL